MARKENLVAKIEKAYEESRAEEAEELHNAVIDIIAEHKMSVEKILGVLDIIRFQYKMAKYKEIMGVVKLTDKPPLKKE